MTSAPRRLSAKDRLHLFWTLLGVLGAIATMPGLAEADHLERVLEARYVMGTVLEITLFHRDRPAARRLLDEAFSIAQRLDDLLSNYKPESEINRLNRKSGTGRVKISADFHDFLEMAKSLSGKTDGAFDITVGPLMELWRKAAEEGHFPSHPSIAAARSLVGSAGIILYRDGSVEFKKAGMRIDTGGIGKGYAVDRIADLFRSREIAHALINFGHSSILALGPAPHAPAWKLLLQFPGEKPLGILEIRDGALSVSSSLGRSFVIGEKAYGHLMDPRTGTPIAEKIHAAVMAPTACVAEALSKLVILRDPPHREGQDLWKEVKILRVDENGKNRRSEGFPLVHSRLTPE